MFKVKAKTNSIKIKDINKYIGRVWITLQDREVLRSKDLLANKNKLIVQTDNPELKALFSVRSTVRTSSVNNINVVQDKDIFVAQPFEIEPEKSDEVFFAEPIVEEPIVKENNAISFDAEKEENDLMDKITEAQNEMNCKAEESKPCEVESAFTAPEPTDPDEIEEVETPIEFTEEVVGEAIEEPIIEVSSLNEDVVINETNIGEIEDTFIVNDLTNIENTHIEDTHIEDTQIKNENNFIYNTKNDVETEPPKRRRGRPSKKSQQ